MLQINTEHPEYASCKTMWRKYRDLYAGGEQLREKATEYLVRRSKEPNDVYFERLNRVFYENYIGSIIDWYAATLMRRGPIITYDGANEAGKNFFSSFGDDCDLKGTTLTEFFRQQLVQALITGKSYIVVDFPRVTAPITTRAQEDAVGKSRGFLVDYSPDEVINWSYDSNGQLEWVVVRTSQLRQTGTEGETWKKETCWIYYNREIFKMYRSVSEPSGQSAKIELVDEGQHGLASQSKVPMFQMRVSDGLWLMNKAALLQLEHFNKSNALSWALTMGLFAIPVIYSEREWSQIVGESYYIQLGPDDKFGWTEPEGHVFQIAADNLERLKDEIYRVCYLMMQAGGTSTSQTSQSGLSKQRDFSITQEVLRAYGDAVKRTMKQVLAAIDVARQDGLLITVSGLDEFDIGDFSAELDDAKKLLSLGIRSETLKRQLYKQLAFKYLSDVSQAVKNQIANEIDKSFESPTGNEEGHGGN
ncbi:MAG TPA: DUF4055 domain-containing protein [Terriglobales bacterium]|nr:DUF4055 domain-containing protein [Terriglobales bacterium]